MTTEILYFIENTDERLNYYVTDKCNQMKSIEKVKSKEHKRFEAFGCYDDMTDLNEILIKFRTDFNLWSDEIKTLFSPNDYDFFDPKSYSTNNTMVMCFFQKYAKRILNQLKIPDIEILESLYMNQTNNGGLYYTEPGYHENCYGYDLSSAYPNFLGNKELDFDIPINEGKQSKYNSIDELYKLYQNKKLNYGYYEIKITSEHPDVIKVFSFSKNNTYTHYDLIFCFVNKRIYKIEFEMIEKEFNCYLYDKKDVIKSHEIFGKWFDKGNIIKEKLPKNRIAKHLVKSLWGMLSQYNRQFITSEEWDKRDDLTRDKNDDKQFLIVKHHNESSIEIIDKKNPYKHNLARIKSFLTSYVRNYMAKMIKTEKLYKNIIRVYVDNVVLNIPHKFTEKTILKPIPEDKTTGSLYFVNGNQYYRKCNKCNEFYDHKIKLCPECH